MHTNCTELQGVTQTAQSSLVFDYPCISHSSCTPFLVHLGRGIYRFDLFGASGGIIRDQPSSARKEGSQGCLYSDSFIESFGGNAKCNKYSSVSGAGGYASGVIVMHRDVDIYINIGGVGGGSGSRLGGYNGGGKGSSGAGGGAGGGGATDIRVQNNTVYHRIIVAGGGGGSDNSYGTYLGDDDGSGGAGGGESGQGFWVNGAYSKNYGGKQSSGHSFGTGESTSCASSVDCAGGGGGWYGGMVSSNYQAGGGGGSSYIHTSTSYHPNGYAFNKDEYTFTNATTYKGFRVGHGYAKITAISQAPTGSFTADKTYVRNWILAIIILMMSS